MNQFTHHGPDDELRWFARSGQTSAKEFAPVGFIQSDHGRHILMACAIRGAMLLMPRFSHIADVCQDRREEVNVAAVGQARLNYGWNITEGTLCFPGDPCNKQGITLPIIEYDHLNNRCSITGGYVYRGTAIPEVQGRYFYSDFCAGGLQSFLFANGKATEQKDWGIQNVGSILSFGEDAKHELYLLSQNGSVYRIVRE